MAIPHFKATEVIDVRPLGTDLQNAQTTTLFREGALEVLRLVMLAGKVIPPHRLPGEVTVHCLEGEVALRVGETERVLRAGELTYLESSMAHSVRAIADSSLLITIVLVHKQPQAEVLAR